MCCKMCETGRIIVLSAPSGTGKSTVIGQLMQHPELKLQFSISATSRNPRGAERHGREYYFLSPEEFNRRVEAGEFVEWEEVYKDTKYGTLVSEVERITGSGHNLIMDIDVAGALNVKKKYGSRALLIFLEPPTIEELEKRLRNRATDDEASIAKRLAKAEYEMSFSPRYDAVVVNDNLDKAVDDIEKLISQFTH